MYQSRTIDQCLVESLAYPRSIALSILNPGSCPHGGYFNDSDHRCWRCSKESVCRWLEAIDWRADASSLSASELIDVLDTAIRFTDQFNAQHDREACDCQTCAWLRDTRHLVKRYRKLNRVIS